MPENIQYASGNHLSQVEANVSKYQQLLLQLALFRCIFFAIVSLLVVVILVRSSWNSVSFARSLPVLKKGYFLHIIISMVVSTFVTCSLFLAAESQFGQLYPSLGLLYVIPALYGIYVTFRGILLPYRMNSSALRYGSRIPRKSFAGFSGRSLMIFLSFTSFFTQLHLKIMLESLYLSQFSAWTLLFLFCCMQIHLKESGEMFRELSTRFTIQSIS